MRVLGVVSRLAPRLTDFITQATTLVLLGIALAHYDQLRTPALDLGALVAILGLLQAGVVLGRTGGELRNNLVRIPGFFAWLYGYHRQAGVLIDDLALPTWERELSAADHALFGGDLSLLLQSLYSPTLTEVIQIAYGMYYVVLLSLPIGLLLRQRHREVAETLGTIAIAHALLVVGNMLFAARWPVLLYQQPSVADVIVYPFPMEGLWLTETMRSSIAGGTRMLWDSMPSGHTCITVLMTITAGRFMPRLLWVMAPLTAAIVFATVYLRYHYGVDVIAGLALALIVSRIALPAQLAWERAPRVL